MRWCVFLLFATLAAAAQTGQTAGTGKQRSATAAQRRAAPRDRAADAELSAGQQRAEGLLRQAYGVLAPLSARERTLLLGRALNVAQIIKSDLVKPWAEELFKAAQELPPEQRTSAEVPAVQAAINIDEELALSLLERMDPPATGSTALSPGSMGGDARSRTAGTLFTRYYQNHPDTALERLRTVAARMGQTGVYPYAAFGPLIQQSARKDPATADRLFGEMVQAFRSSAYSFGDVGEFTRLLLTANHNVSAPLYREAVLNAVNAAQRVTSIGAMTASFSGANGSAELSGADSLLLLELLPLLRGVDPATAQQVLNSRSDLASVEQLRSGNSGFSSVTYRSAASGAGSVSGTMRSASSSAQTPPDFQRVPLAQVRSLAEFDPQQALRFTQANISDPAARAAAYAEISAGFAARNDPEQAALYLQQATVGLAQIDDPRQRARAYASMAQASFAAGNTGAALNYMEQGFSATEELMRADYDAHPDRMAMSLTGADEMAQLVRTGMRADPDNTVERIATARYPNLRAYLYIVAAEEVARPRGPRPGGRAAVN